MRNKKSISLDYFYITSFYIVFLVLVLIIFSVNAYFIEKKRLDEKLIKSAASIEQVLTESFGYSSQLANFMGSTIAEQNTFNAKNILDILSGKLVTNEIAKNIFSFTIFDWIRPDKKLIISGPYGILKEPAELFSFGFISILLL